MIRLFAKSYPIELSMSDQSRLMEIVNGIYKSSWYANIEDGQVYLCNYETPKKTHWIEFCIFNLYPAICDISGKDFSSEEIVSILYSTSIVGCLYRRYTDIPHENIKNKSEKYGAE